MNISTISPLFLPSLVGDILMDYPFEKFIDTNRSSITTSSDYSGLHRFVIRCLSLYALSLVIIGTLGNLLTIIILCRRNLRRYVTMRYLIAVSVSDIISLYGWNLNNFYKFTVSSDKTNLEEISLVHCRLVSYFSFVGLQLSSWFLTAVSLDRCLSLYFLTWKQKYGKLSHTKYHIAILTIISLILNCHILFFNGYHPDPSSNKIKCYATRTNPHYIFPQWERVHLVIYNLCPFIIMLSCNVYIIYITVRSARVRTSRRTKNSSGKSSNSNISRHRQLTLMLMLVTFAFVLLTLPSCIYFVFFRHRMSSTNYSRSFRHMVQICLSSTQFTAHAINFFLYCFSATNFRNELRDFIQEICLNRLSALKSNKPSTTPIKLTTFNKNKRNTRKSNSESTLECQQAEHINTIKDIQIFLKEEMNKDFNRDNENISS